MWKLILRSGGIVNKLWMINIGIIAPIETEPPLLRINGIIIHHGPPTLFAARWAVYAYIVPNTIKNVEYTRIIMAESLEVARYSVPAANRAKTVVFSCNELCPEREEVWKNIAGSRACGMFSLGDICYCDSLLDTPSVKLAIAAGLREMSETELEGAYFDIHLNNLTGAFADALRCIPLFNSLPDDHEFYNSFCSLPPEIEKSPLLTQIQEVGRRIYNALYLYSGGPAPGRKSYSRTLTIPGSRFFLLDARTTRTRGGPPIDRDDYPWLTRAADALNTTNNYILTQLPPRVPGEHNLSLAAHCLRDNHVERLLRCFSKDALGRYTDEGDVAWDGLYLYPDALNDLELFARRINAAGIIAGDVHYSYLCCFRGTPLCVTSGTGSLLPKALRHPLSIAGTSDGISPIFIRSYALCCDGGTELCVNRDEAAPPLMKESSSSCCALS